MPGKVFDLDEPNPNRALEALRQAAVNARDIGDSLILDSLDRAGVDAGQDDTVSTLILAVLDDQLRDDGQDSVVGQLILDSLDAQVRADEVEQRNADQDEAINLLILEALSGSLAL
jgi:hypothetical protein